MPEKPVNKGFLAHRRLFELNRSGRLTRQIIEHAVHALHLVDDPAHHLLQHFKRDLRRLGGHEVHGLHRPERHGVIIGPLIAHNAYRAHVGQCREILVDLLVQPALRSLRGRSRLRPGRSSPSRPSLRR